MSNKEQADHQSSDNEDLLLDEQEDEGDRVHLQDEDEQGAVRTTAAEGTKRKKRLSKVSKPKAEAPKKDIKKSKLS